MWTDRKKVLKKYEEIIKYIDSMDNFHDCRIGNINYRGKTIEITVEDIATESKNESGLIWNFTFENVTSFEFDADCVVGFVILEIVKGDQNNSICFDLNNGKLYVEAESISLGIPS